MKISSTATILLCYDESIPVDYVSLIQNKLEVFGVVTLQPISSLSHTSYSRNALIVF